MTTLAMKISETPMAPYTELLRSMKTHDLRIVVTFLQETIAEKDKKEGSEMAADIIRKKFKGLKISKETKELVRGLSLSAEEVNDEKTKHILGYKG